MAENIKTVKPAGGGDYSTYAAWEAALAADPTDDQVAEGYDGDGGGLTIDVSNASNVRIVIRAASGQSFRDQAEWATSMYAAVGQGAWIGNDAGGLTFNSSNIHVEDMGIHLSNSAHNMNGTGEITFNRCFVYRSRLQANDGGVTAGATVRIYNTVWVTYSSAVIWARHADSDLEVINSVIAIEPGQSGDHGIIRSDGTATAKNVWSINFGSGSCFTGTVGGDYNGSTDNTAPGTNYQRSITVTDWFVANGATTFDYHLKSAKFGDFVGTDESGTIGSTDIDGETRTQYDVGADATAVVPGQPAAARFVWIMDSPRNGHRLTPYAR